ncbi:MAG: toprim domain-containing protein [Pseudomonadota bacterium]
MNFDFKELKSKIAIDQVLRAYGLDRWLHRKNDYLYGPCPLHRGDNITAFRVHLSRGVWHCFTGCGGGDIVELVRHIEKCSYAQAGRILSRLIENAGPQPRFQPPLLAKRAFRPYTQRLFLNPNVPFLQDHKKISVHTAFTYEAGTSAKSAFLKDMVAVRLYDLTGNPLGYCGRRLDPLEIKKRGKWRFPPNFPKSTVLFNAHRAIPYIHKGIILVECPWAAMRFAQANVKNTAALLGTALSPIQIQWITKAPKVLLMLDGDPAGNKAANHIFAMLKGRLDVIVYRLPDGLEPEDLPDDKIKSIALHYSFL